MHRRAFALGLTAAAIAAAGCNPTQPSSPPSVPTNAPAAASTAAAGAATAASGAAATAAPAIAGAATAAATTVAGVSGGASSNGTAALRLSGKVASFTGGKVTLDDGKSFSVDASTRFSRSMAATLADLKPGDFVAITAKRQSDNTLLATIVNVFPPSLNGTGAGQRPMTGGNLMTNATIDQVSSDGFSVSFPEGTATVKLAPDAKITRSVDATQSDLQEGVNVSALVANDVARAVTIVA